MPCIESLKLDLGPMNDSRMTSGKLKILMLGLKCHCKLLEMKTVKLPFLILSLLRTSIYPRKHEGVRGSWVPRALLGYLSPAVYPTSVSSQGWEPVYLLP